MNKSTTIPENLSGVAQEAKALVALAFRNGPIENVHAGRRAQNVTVAPSISRITQDEMRQIMKTAFDRLYTFLVLKERDQKAYEALLRVGKRYTTTWDEPVLTKLFWSGNLCC